MTVCTLCRTAHAMTPRTADKYSCRGANLCRPCAVQVARARDVVFNLRRNAKTNSTATLLLSSILVEGVGL